MKKIAVLTMLLAAFSAASAQDSGAYVVGGLGVAKVDLGNLKNDIGSALIDSGAAGVTTTDNSSDLSWKLGAGYRLSNFLALEATVVDFGKASAKAQGDLGGNPINGKVTFDAWAISMDAVGALPINEQWSAFAKVGAAWAKVKAKATVSSAGVTGWASETSSEVVPKLGIGGQYNFSKTWSVRAEAERYFNVGKKNKTVESDIDVFGASVVYNF